MIADLRTTVLIGALAGACGGSASQTEPSLSGDISVSGGLARIHSSTETAMWSVDPFVADQYPISLDRYKACVDEGPCPPEPPAAAEKRAVYDDTPANRLLRTWALPSAEGAQIFCRWKGRNLLARAQFVLGAVGPFPFGDSAKPVGGPCGPSRLELGCLKLQGAEGLGAIARVPRFVLGNDGQIDLVGEGVLVDEARVVDPNDPRVVAYFSCAREAI